MNRSLLFLLLFSVSILPVSSLQADQASLDKLAKNAQADVDNEAVSVYGGKVGKLEALFFLEIAGTGKRVDGYYYYPSRNKGKRYTLKGSNPKDGVILLKEHTPGADGKLKLTAHCHLTKRVTKSRIIWEGKMNNIDGRTFKMSFSRPR